MTTTVKGVGRARHSANRRHQQTTPLPPRDGSQDSTPAEVAAKDASRKAEVSTCPLKGCGKVHRPGSDLGRKHRTLAADEAANGYAPTSVRALRTRRANAAAEKDAPAVADAKTAEESPRTSKAGKRSLKATEVVPADAPGAAKAQRLVDAAGEAGWRASVTVSGTTVRVLVSRGEDEQILTTLTDGKLDLSEMPTYMTKGGRSVKLKNVSAVINQMSGAKPTARPVSDTPRAPRRTKAQRAEESPRPLPFDVKGASDEEVLDAIRGRAIEWMNGISRKVEEAVVAATIQVRNPKYKKGQSTGEPEYIDRPAPVKIEEHPNRATRVVTFTDHGGTGFRSVALDRLTSVK